MKYLRCGPARSYHGGDFANHPIFGVDACNLVFILLARVKTLNMGGCIAFNASAHPRLETLSLRCKAHCVNATIAEWLNGHEAAKEGSVLSISLPSHPSHELAKIFPAEFLRVRVHLRAGRRHRGPGPRAARSSSRPRTCAHLANVGDARTLVIHPASTTHQQLTTTRSRPLKPAGVRISVGYTEDIKADIDQAFAVARA